MTFAGLFLAAAYTFTATATGVEKGTPIEFIFAGANSDRDYESMFLLDGSVDDFCNGLEKAGLPRGRPVDASSCRLWPVGCHLTISPAIGQFVAGKMPEGLPPAIPIYTGGTRDAKGACEATAEMPASVWANYTIAQSPIVYNGIFDQGAVYGAFTAARKLKKGERVSFTISWDASTMPHSIVLTAKPGNSLDIIKRLKVESEKGELDALIAFDGALTVHEATALSSVLSSIDSARVKINGSSNIFYRAFTPLIKWLERKDRLQQPFELTLGSNGTPDKLVFIEEDWTVEGNDPKLTPKEIPFEDAIKHERVDTCFIFASSTDTVARVTSAMSRLKDANVINYYVFTGQ